MSAPVVTVGRQHSLGGSSHVGRIINASLERIIKNASWRKHTHLISSCKSSLILLQSLSPDASPNSSSSLLGISSSDSYTLLSSLLLALNSSSPKLIEIALDCLIRLTSLRFLCGFILPEPSSILFYLFDSICSLTTSASDDTIELSILRLFLAALRSDTLIFRGDSTVNVIKSCYSVYLGSTSLFNQMVAKLVLAQILRIVFARVEVDSITVKVEIVTVADLFDLSDNNLNNSSLVQVVQGFIDEAMAWSGGRDEEESVENERVGEVGDELSKIREDGIYLFRNLCKFLMKFSSGEGPEEPLLLKGKVLSLELLKMVLENAGLIWRTNDK